MGGEGFKLPIPPERAQGLKPYIGKQVFMGIRPEDIYDADYVAPNIHPGNIDAKVEVTELMGNEVFLYLLTGGNSYIARVDPRTKAKVGQTCAWWPTWTTSTSSRRTRRTTAPCAKHCAAGIHSCSLRTRL